MRLNRYVKMGIDLVMTALMFCQTAYLLIGETAHEWVGTLLFALFILHHALNWRWYRGLGKGRWPAARILQTAVNFLLLACMLGLMVSGVILSREVFRFLPVSGGMRFARILHMLSAYWGFVLVGVHAGLHWGMVISMLPKKRAGAKTAASVRKWALRAAALLCCGFGVYAFVKHRIADYLFLRSQFVYAPPMACSGCFCGALGKKRPPLQGKPPFWGVLLKKAFDAPDAPLPPGGANAFFICFFLKETRLFRKGPPYKKWGWT